MQKSFLVLFLLSCIVCNNLFANEKYTKEQIGVTTVNGNYCTAGIKK